MPADQHYANLWLSLVPEDVRKSITPAELNDRVIEAARLSKRAADLTLRKEDREEARSRAQQVMRAAPRAETERLVAEKISKAAQLGDSAQAGMLRRQARDLLDQNPPAPRRDAAVRKAEAVADEMPVPVFDADGNLLGVVDQDDITLVAGSGGGSKAAQVPGGTGAAGAAAAAQDPALDGQVVKALGSRMIVRDQFGRRYLTERRSIRTASSETVRKALDDDSVTLYDVGGRAYRVSRSAIQSPAQQARDTGPVNAGGTTGMGQTRKTGPAGALPGDTDRAVVKSLNRGWTAVYDYTGRLAGAVKTSNVVAPPRAGTVAKSRIDQTHANVYNAQRRKVGMAPVAHIIPVADLRKALGTTRPRGQAGR
jgi:hypothetical protein